MFINNNFTFCYLCIWKVSSTNFLEECKYVKKKKKKKTNNYIDKELESESDTDSDSDNGIYIDSDNEE